MEEKNKITEQEQVVLNNLYTILTNYNVSRELYLISEEYQNSEHVKICLTKTPLGKWNTCLKLHAGVYDSIYHPSITTAVIKFIQCVASNDEQSISMIQEFLNLNIAPTLSNKNVKCRRKKR